MADARYTINIHMDDDVKVEAFRIPSSDKDFVSLKIDSQSSILIMNLAQAKAIMNAATEAYAILMVIDQNKQSADQYSYGVKPCTILDPCADCLEVEANAQKGPDYPDWDGEF